jgi:DNA end-binding protein Ku
MLHRECGTPIKQKRWCPVHDREVGPDEIVKGWEVAKGEFVIVEDADLEALERQDTSRTIEIQQFVDAADVDPIYFDRTYFLAPAANAAARRPYVLLLHAMQETGRAALGRFVLAGKEKLVLIRARGGGLALETLFLHEDVYSQAEIDEAVADVEVKDAELTLAQQVIESLAGDFDATTLTSDYRRDLKAMLQAKLAGAEVATPEPVVEDAPVVDLMEALRKSVADAKERAAGGSNGGKKAKAAPKSGSRARRAPARKSA